MSKIDWKLVWEKTLKNKDIFPIKNISNNTVSISCPTRFNNTGMFSINITPTFNTDSIVLELLVFNDNVIFNDIKNKKVSKNNDNDYNKYADKLLQYELNNRIMERFKIKSSGFESNEDAISALVDYINEKATESGRMFDNKLDELNDTNSKKENHIKLVDTIATNRKLIFSKIECILKSNYNWKPLKNESYEDSVASFYDQNGNLTAVVSLVDDCIVVDLARDITAKVSMLQADADIENELVGDISNAQDIIANREIDQLKDVIANANDDAAVDPVVDNVANDDYLESLTRRITKLESLYIKRALSLYR